jgi:hypothetical protein
MSLNSKIKGQQSKAKHCRIYKTLYLRWIEVFSLDASASPEGSPRMASLTFSCYTFYWNWADLLQIFFFLVFSSLVFYFFLTFMVISFCSCFLWCDHSVLESGFKRLVHVLCYFGMILQHFGMKIYYDLWLNFPVDVDVFTK